MTGLVPLCRRCGRSSCPSLRGAHLPCPLEELDELTAEWVALLTDRDDVPRLAAALAELSFNVKALRARVGKL